jgi:hypothetical protein
MERSKEEWMNILRHKDSSTAADRIFGDLGGYPNTGTRNFKAWIVHDTTQLANALEAYAELNRSRTIPLFKH